MRSLTMMEAVLACLMGLTGIGWTKEVPPVATPPREASLVVEPLASMPVGAILMETPLSEALASAVAVTNGPLVIRAGSDADSLGLLVDLTLPGMPHSQGAGNDDPAVYEGDHFRLLFFREGAMKNMFHEMAVNAEGRVTDGTRMTLESTLHREWQSHARVEVIRTGTGRRWSVTLPLTAVGWEAWPKGAQCMAMWVSRGELPKTAWHPLDWPAFKPTGEPSWLGIGIGDMDPFAGQELGIDLGIRVIQVHPGTPADQAGLRVEDIILLLDGKTPQNLQEFSATIRAYPAGKRVTLEIFRDGKRVTIPILVAPKPKHPPKG